MNFIINVLKNIEEEVRLEVKEGNNVWNETIAPSEYDVDRITIDKMKTPSLYKIMKSTSIELTKHELSGILRDLHCMSLDESNDFAFDLEAVTGFKRKKIVVPQVTTNNSFKKLVPEKN